MASEKDPSLMRRHRRIPLRIPVIIVGPRGQVQLLTDDVSLAGIFVRTDSPRKLRQLVQVKVPIVDSGEEIKLLAMVAHSVSTHEAETTDRIAGMGLNLYGVRPAVLAKWTAFVEKCTADYDALADEGAGAMVQRVLAADAGRATRPSVGIRVGSVSTLYELMRPDLGGEGRFVPTSETLAPGTEVAVVVSHPEDGSEFTLTARVVRRATRGSETGVAIVFDPLDAATRTAYTTYIESAIPLLEDDDIIVEADDPLLL